MNARMDYRREPSARADTDEMRAAMFLASKEGIHYSDAVERVRAGQVDESDIYRSKQ